MNKYTYIISRQKCIIIFGQNLVILVMMLWRDPYALCGPHSGAKRPEQHKTCLERPACRVCTLYIVLCSVSNGSEFTKTQLVFITT